MSKLFKISWIFLTVILICQSCSTESDELISYDAKGENAAGGFIEIPDANFRNTLLNSNCVDSDADGVADSDVDLNDDGKIDKKEANAVEHLILRFDYGLPLTFVDLTGIENFRNLKSLDLSGTSNDFYHDTATNTENLTYDFTGLRKLEYLKMYLLATEYFDLIDLSGLTKLQEVDLSGNRPMDYYSERDKFININLEGCTSLKKLKYQNSWLKVDFCQVPSLEVLDMFYLEGGEPDVFDFHCLTNLKYLNIAENMVDALILKNNSLLDEFVYYSYTEEKEWFYPSPNYICIDDDPLEYEQITPLIGTNTLVNSDCIY
ncbi:hypothetical protein [Christiangramia sp. SM2212]|uniref:Leucine-rich repeat domain-containing protein n=1 Tax=Christiangramia sediminicola TaxID=3073267 RepID=A0ABU1EL22_9FLAO|nr:hypothetical protein [Christiangramia sp. SM2212]MDR5589076.1 hypothetical protein [Christiangramia sp. SM2212]